MLLLKFKKLLKKLKNKLYYIVAGEASGDLHGAHIMSCIINNVPDIRFRGVGGPLMGARGLRSLVPFGRLAVIGFFEAFKDLLFFIKIKKQIVRDVLSVQPEKIILIDYPGFNLLLAKEIKKTINIPIIFYISPQVWAWKEGRISIIKNCVDKLIVVFPFEKPWYKKRNIDVQYFGHPSIDLYKKSVLLKKSLSSPVIGLFPGSRKQEIAKHVPLFVKIVKLILKTNPQMQFVVGLAPGIDPHKIKKLTQLNNVIIKNNDSLKIFNESSVAIVASGTAALECAITKTPFVVIYKTSFLSWVLVKCFLSVSYASMVNILAKKPIIKEFLQYQTSPSKIADYTITLLEGPDKTIKNLSSVVDTLGSGQAYEQAAQYIVNY